MQIWSAEIKEIERLYEAVQDQLPELGKELAPLIDTADANVILLYSRRCLEVIITDLCQCELKRPRKTEPLKGIIDKLNKEEKVPSHIITSMDHLNSLAVYGTHRKDFDPEQVKPVLVNLAVIIRWYLKYKVPGQIIKAEPGEEKAGAEVKEGAVLTTGKTATKVTRGFLAKLKIKYSLPAIIIIALTILFVFSSGSTLPFSERDWIIITDFENLTQNPVFDKSLYTAFFLSTSQSRYINLFPKERMLETLARMEIKDRTFVDEKTGREVAVREGINIYIIPSISEAGNRYAIGAKIMETSSGNLLRSEIFYAENEYEILPALDKLSRRLRRTLGESRYKIAGQDKSLMKVTSSSLEALKQYTLGTENLALKMNYKDAKEYFENALRLDSGFTAARASLGILNIERFDLAKGRELLDQAAKSVDKLTERERLNITAIHAFYVENDIPKCIEYTKKVAELYPDDPAYHNNLGVYYMRTNRFEESLKEYKTALKIRPDMGVVYQGIVWIYLQNLVRIDSALVWADKWISNNPQNAWAHFYQGLAYVSIDSLAKAETSFVNTREIAPDFIWNLYDLTHIYRLRGRYQEAINILEKIKETDKNETAVYYNLGLNYQLAGNQKEANKYYSIYKNITEEWIKRNPGDAEVYISLGAVTARSGDSEYSEQMLRKAIELDSTLHIQFSEVLCVQGKIPEALDELEKALDNGYRELFWLKLNPNCQALQYDVRFRSLIDKYFK